MKKPITILTAAALLAVLCFGCSKNVPDAPNSLQGNENDFTLSFISDTLDRENIFTNRDISASYDDKIYNITLADHQSSSDNKKVEINDNIITITNTGTYIIKGKLTDGQIVVDADDTDKIQLVLNGVDISSQSTAAIHITEAKKVFITMAEKSKNTLSTANEFVRTEKNKADGVIYSKQNLTLNGSGQLQIQSPYGHGIVCNDDLIIASGTCTITAAKHSIKANDNINIADGKLNLTAKKDALHCDNDSDDKQGNIYIKNAEISIHAEDDALHASRSIILDNGNIHIENSYEGIEAQNIEIYGGNIRIKATDDGLNAASTKSTDTQNTDNKTNRANPFDGDENCYIYIAGGTLVVDADGDGIDSNGYLQQTGGDVTVYGAENNGNGALDYSISSKITGGNMIAFGYSGMAQGFGANSTQGSVLIHFDSETTDAFILTDSKNNQIITAKTDKKYNSVAVSTKEIEKGKTYTASAGSQSKTIKMNEITYTDTSAFENGKPNGKGKPDDNEVEGGKPENNDKMPNDNPPPEPPNGNNENQNPA